MINLFFLSLRIPRVDSMSSYLLSCSFSLTLSTTQQIGKFTSQFLSLYISVCIYTYICKHKLPNSYLIHLLNLWDSCELCRPATSALMYVFSSLLCINFISAVWFWFQFQFQFPSLLCCLLREFVILFWSTFIELRVWSV